MALERGVCQIPEPYTAGLFPFKLSPGGSSGAKESVVMIDDEADEDSAVAIDEDETGDKIARGVHAWWQFGLYGGIGLSFIGAIRLIRAVISGIAGQASWAEAIGFVALMFGMGFMCGVMVWAGRGLYHTLGMLGDAIVGLVVLVCFCLSCMLVFSPEMLGAMFSSAGIPMLVLAAVLGLIGGAWTGHDLRKEMAKKNTEQ
jgi:hypothetical protein